MKVCMHGKEEGKWNRAAFIKKGTCWDIGGDSALCRAALGQVADMERQAARVEMALLPLHYFLCALNEAS